MAAKKTWQVDQALVKACLDGDDKAWEQLILKYRRLIFSIPVSYRIPTDDAEDIFQRVVVKLFHGLADMRRIESLASWLVVTTRRECQAFKRGASRFDSLDDETAEELSEDPVDVVSDIHQLQCEHTLAEAFEQLDESCNELLTMFYLEDPAPSYKEIADRLGRPLGALGPTRARCLKKLQTIYLKLGGKPN